MAFERSWFGCLGAALGGLLVAGGCGMRAESIGGETHFLRYCSADSAVCGAFDCLEQVCTWPCSEERHCAELPGARCALNEVEPTSERGAYGRCEVRCVRDEDCSVVSSAHRCEAEFCRVGVLTSSGSGGGPTSPEPNTSGSPGASGGSAGECAAGRLSNDHRVVLGDSFFVTSPPFATALDDAGRYRDYSNLDFNALAFGGRGIEEQYLRAWDEGPVETLIMTGGGADVLWGSCASVDSTCPVIVEAADAARSLFGRLPGDGIERVFYVGYPEPQVPEVKERMDALRPLLQEICRTSVVPCSFIDLRPVFEGRYESYVLADGLTPSATGVRAIADVVKAALRRECLEP